MRSGLKASVNNAQLGDLFACFIEIRLSLGSSSKFGTSYLGQRRNHVSEGPGTTDLTLHQAQLSETLKHVVQLCRGYGAIEPTNENVCAEPEFNELAFAHGESAVFELGKRGAHVQVT
jgi:hypothetical protein